MIWSTVKEHLGAHRVILVVTFFLFISSFSFAQNTPLNKHLDVFKTDEKVTAQKVWRLYQENKIELLNKKTSQGFSDQIFWVVIKKEDLNLNMESIIEVKNPNIDSIQLFKVDPNLNKVTLMGMAGDRIKAKEKMLAYRVHAFLISNADIANHYLLKIDKRNASVSFPIYVWQKSEFERDIKKRNILFSFGFGVLFIVSVISIAIGLFTRQKEFIAYSFYIFSMLAYLIITLGFGYYFIYPETPEINNNLRTCSLLFLVLATVLFNREYFRINSLSKYIKMGYKLIIVSLLTLLAFWWPFYDFYIKNSVIILNIMYFIVFVHFITIIATIISVYDRQRRDALFYILAFSLLIIGSFLTIFIEYGVIPESLFQSPPMIYGVIAEIIVLTLGLSFRYRNLFYEKRSLENEYLEHLEEIKKLNEQNVSLKMSVTEPMKVVETKVLSKFASIGRSNLKIADIKYITVEGRYSNIFIKNKENPFVERVSLSEIQNTLDSLNFVRIHRSFIVNIDCVVTINDESLALSSGEILPIGKSYRQNILETMSS